MPFARFMELALYDPAGGYYRVRGRPAGPGRRLPDGAGAASDLRGAAGARGEEAWDRLGRPEPFVVVEHGAGEGALAVPLLGALPASIRYRPVEVDDRRLVRLRGRLASAGSADRLDDGSADEPFDGVIIANEVLDALPVHRVRQRGIRPARAGGRRRCRRRVRRGRDHADDAGARRATRRSRASSSSTARPPRSASRSTTGSRRLPRRCAAGCSSSSTTALRQPSCMTRSVDATARFARMSGTRSTTTRTGSSVART